MPLIKIGGVGGGGGGRGLKEVVSCLALDMLSLRYLWDSQVVMFNREMENKTKAVGNLD